MDIYYPRNVCKTQTIFPLHGNYYINYIYLHTMAQALLRTKAKEIQETAPPGD